MKKRFVIAIDSSDNPSEKELIKFFKEKKIGWWHWINNFWLIVSKEEEIEPKMLRDAINERFPKGTRQIIFEVNEYTGFAGMGPTGDEKDMFKWIKSSWKLDE